MKKNLLFILLTISLTALSQSWTPETAYWIYNYSGLTSQGNIRLSYLRDTSIAGKDCQILKKDEIIYSYWDSTSYYHVMDNEVTYYESGVTYILNEDHFDTLYFFSAKKNDRYSITNKLSWNENSHAYADVIDTGQIEINSVNLKWLAVKYHFIVYDVDHTVSDTIIERIGSSRYYFLPWDIINGSVDGNVGGNLKCYHDSLIGVYNNENYGDCNFDIGTGIPTLYTDNTIDIFPNPADNEFSVHFKNKQIANSVLVYSSSGQIIDLEKFAPYTDELKINTSAWKEGLYLLIIQYKSEVIKNKIIIVHPGKK